MEIDVEKIEMRVNGYLAAAIVAQDLHRRLRAVGEGTIYTRHIY